MDKNMEIISQLMVTITQTNEWFRICHEDVQIQRATLDLQTVMERIAALIPEALMDELWDALGNLEPAQETAAILYGIRVAGAIRDVATRSADLSHYVIDRAAQGGWARMDNAKLWEIRRYVDNVKVQNTTQAFPTTKELLALGQFAGDGLYDAILLAFAYGRAKGWQAAKGDAA